MNNSLSQCANIFDLQNLAKVKIPAPFYDLISSGVGGQETLRRNVADFDRYNLNQHILRDVSQVDLTARILGMDVSFPLILSPTGGQGLLHADGELGAARAAAKAGIVYTYPVFGSLSPEEVAEAGPAPRVFQLNPLKDRKIEAELIERARAANYNALCITADQPVLPRVDALHRWRLFDQPPSAKTILAILRKPSWLLSQRSLARRLKPYAVRLHEERGHAMSHDFINSTIRRTLSWDQIPEYRRLWQGPLILKGVINVEDAKRAARIGVDGIIVCNHGGGAVDGAPSSIRVLERIRDAIGDSTEILLGSGIRRGTSMVKAIALGAKAAVIGRAFLFGLAAAGEEGVSHAIEMLREEFEMTLRQIGCTSVDKLDRNYIYGA